MMENYPRGSEWRRWDLHVHTPDTQKNDRFEGNDTTEKWGLFYKSINDYVGDGSNPTKNIAVIGITDYLSVDNYLKVIRDNKLPESVKLVLPNVELRIAPISKKGPTNIHCIFNPEIADKLESRFFSNLKVYYNGIEYSASKQGLIDYGRKYAGDSGLDERKALSTGIDQFVLQENVLEEVFKNNSELRANTIIVVPNSNQDGASGITQNKNYDAENGSQLDASKRAIYQLADMVFSGNPNDALYFVGEKQDDKETVIRKYGSLKPCIHGSDAHCNKDLFEPDNHRYCWIKADPTFEGLRQIKFEPEIRVRIQENMPEMKTDYQVIEAIEISHKDFGEQKILFNQNLNTIIGGRSSGKSILLGAVAKLANYMGNIKDSEEYNKYIENIVKSMKLIWRDHEELVNRKVEYFPQTYINGLAAESENTIKLIENILKEDNERRLAFETYDSEISKNTINISNGVENYIKLQYRLKHVDDGIVAIGDLTGINAEIEKISKQIETVRAKSTVKLTDAEEHSYTDLKQEKQGLQEIIEFQGNVAKQLVQLKDEKLVKDISGDFIGLPENVKCDFLNKLNEITNQVDSVWGEFVDSIISQTQKVYTKNTSKTKIEPFYN